MKPLLKIYLILTVLLFSCDSKPTVNFEEPVNGKFLDLSKEIGDSIFVTKNIDTLKYRKYSFIYDGKNNLIIKDNLDTVFEGTATKRKELILLNRELKNGKYAIHALKLTDSTITGLETEWIQSILIDSITRTPDYQKNIIDTSNTKTINVNKKDAKNIFRWAVNQLEPLYIINPHKKSKTEYPEERLNEPTSEAVDKLVKSVYPNPFQTTFTVETHANSSYSFIVYSSTGTHLLTDKRTGDSFKFDLSNAQNGLIYLTIVDLNNENQKDIEKIKLMKK